MRGSTCSCLLLSFFYGTNIHFIHVGPLGDGVSSLLFEFSLIKYEVCEIFDGYSVKCVH